MGSDDAKGQLGTGDTGTPASSMKESNVTAPAQSRSESSGPVNGSTAEHAIPIDSDSESVYHNIPTFKRAIVPNTRPDDENIVANTIGDQAIPPKPPQDTNGTEHKALIRCKACVQFHEVGSCPLKLAGVEHCNLCGIAHYGHARVCPHIQSETQVRAMLEALKYSNEPEHLVNEARRYLRGLKGNLVQMKKQKELKQQQAQFVGGGPSTMQQNMNGWAPQPQNQNAGYGVPAWSSVGGYHGGA